MPQKFKLKPSWIGLFLIAVMLFSTFAYAVIQSFNPQQASFPESNIIDYRLRPEFREALIQYGATVITFEYNLGCENCVIQKSALEFYANEYKEQIFLEEILNESIDNSKTTITSIYGNEELININETELAFVLCKSMVAPPATCALVT